MKNLKAKDIMNYNILAVGLDWSVEQLADYLLENSISGAPVISEDGKLLGVVSLTDIVRHKSTPATDAYPDNPHEYYIHVPERGYSQSEIESFSIDAESLVIVRDIMTTKTYTVSENTSLKDVAEAMIRGGIHRVFVTRDDTLAGIITTMDILKVIRDL
jgi:CBS domain-containing protein